MEPIHALRPDLNRRLIAYSTESWNAYESVHLLQQITSLLPKFTAELSGLYGRAGLGDARRAWAGVADCVSAMLDVPISMESLIDLGFYAVSEVGHMIISPNEFSLAGSPILQRLDGRMVTNGDLAPLLRVAVAHDQVALPLHNKFREELHSYDSEVEYIIHEMNHEGSEEPELVSLRALVRTIPSTPAAFPEWDGRPLFLEEQKVLLDYMIKCMGMEIVAHNLVDDQLGRILLDRCGALVYSDITGETVLNPNVAPLKIQRRPVELVCHQAGNAVLRSLRSFDPDTDVLDRLYIIEMAVWNELAIDVSAALEDTRRFALDRSLSEIDVFTNEVLQRRVEPIKPFEFPEL